MRVLWLVRENLTRHPGGDTVQILETAKALRALGVTVDMSDRCGGVLGRYDCVHLFHLDRLWENVEHCRRIRAAGVPAVLSPIYWPGDEYDRGGRTGFQGLLARVFGSEAYRSLRLAQRWGMAWGWRVGRWRWNRPTVSFRRSAAYVLRTVSVLLPNSLAEQEQIERYFGQSMQSVVVPNAADGETFSPPPPAKWPKGRNGVLCVGRIEPRKNQRALIAALHGTGIDLTLVGQVGRYSSRYYRRCVREAGPEARFIGFRSPAELCSLYRSARIHANVSWYETPGLASLEAALCGCAVVATPGGCTREYLKDQAQYCRPDDPASIRTAIEAALSQGPHSELAARVATDFTWSAAAARTLEAYHLACDRGRTESRTAGE
jgi:glycosyltransferase involved in cell wall biosynthesis